MRKLSLLLTLLFCSTVAFTQKIDLDKLNFKASYLQLPTNPFPEEYTTFSTKFIANGINLDDAGFANGESGLASTYFNVSGFKKVNTGGHFTIKVQIDGYDMGKPETVKKETTTKDKDGKETTTVSYTLKFKYLVPMMYTITDLNGKILKDGPIVEGSIEKSYETSSYSTTAALEKYWNDNAATTKRGLLGGFISEKLSLFQAQLENEIGYVPRTNTDILWTTDSPKHPENDAFKKACEDTKLTMAEMTVIVPLNPTKVKPIIAYYDSVLVKYTKDEKPERKLRYAAWYNMSTIYYWLEDFDNAVRCSEGLIANDYDKNDGKEIKSGSEKLKAKLVNGRFKTRHYVRDVSNAVAPEMTQAQKDEEETRQNALKDKAMREAAEREAISQRRTSSGMGGMLDVDKSVKAIGGSINAIGGLLGGEKYREKQKQREEIKELNKSMKELGDVLESRTRMIKQENDVTVVFDKEMADFIMAMNETLASYKLILKSLRPQGCSQNPTVEMVSQFETFKKLSSIQIGNLDGQSANKVKALIESYEKLMTKDIVSNYAAPKDVTKIDGPMEYAAFKQFEDTSLCMESITKAVKDKEKEKVKIILLLSELQKTLTYGTYGLYINADPACHQNTYEIAKSIFLRFRILENEVKLSPELKLQYTQLRELYSKFLKSEKSTLSESQNIQLVENINKNEYPTFILNLLKTK